MSTSNTQISIWSARDLNPISPASREFSLKMFPLFDKFTQQISCQLLVPHHISSLYFDTVSSVILHSSCELCLFNSFPVLRGCQLVLCLPFLYVCATSHAQINIFHGVREIAQYGICSRRQKHLLFKSDKHGYRLINDRCTTRSTTGETMAEWAHKDVAGA